MLTEEKKNFLNNIFYPNNETKIFFESDLNIELEKVLCTCPIFSCDNLIDEVRENNLLDAIVKIGTFLSENSNYNETLHKLYPKENTIGIIKLVLINYVFWFSNTLEEYCGVNFAETPECILYCKD